jgi:hypothetical protein
MGLRGAMMVAAGVMLVAGISAAGFVAMRSSSASTSAAAAPMAPHAEAPTQPVTLAPPPAPVVDVNDLPRAGASAQPKRSGHAPQSSHGEIVRQPGF